MNKLASIVEDNPVRKKKCDLFIAMVKYTISQVNIQLNPRVSPGCKKVLL